MSRGVTSRWRKDLTLSPKYKFWLRGVQGIGSGAVVDESGNGAHGVLNSLTDAACWANAGAFTIGTLAGHVVSIPANKFTWDGTSQSLVLKFDIKLANPAAFGAVISCESAIADIGLSIRTDNLGNIYPKLRYLSVANAYNAEKILAMDGGKHQCVFAFDALSRMLYTYLDTAPAGPGIDISGHYDAVDALTETPNTPTLVNQDLVFGAQNKSTAPWAAQFNDVEALVFDGGLPSNLQSIIDQSFSQPRFPITDKVLP